MGVGKSYNEKGTRIILASYENYISKVTRKMRIMLEKERGGGRCTSSEALASSRSRKERMK